LISDNLKIILSNILNARMYFYPKLPTSRKEVHEPLHLLDIKINKCGLFLFDNDALNDIVIFHVQQT
jgi:hypothetical protein